MISMIGPFVYSLKKDSEIFWCFEYLMKKIEQHLSEDPLPDKMSRLMMYVRLVHSEL